jgi:hypothetical protein
MYHHATYYEFVGTRRPAAIIVHPYAWITPQKIEAVAHRYGLRARMFEPSWDHPEATTIVFSAA